MPAVENNRLLLARQLHIDPTTIQVISAEKVEWSTSCLGLGQANESCAAVITPGYKITFGVAGQEYVIHTDEGGYQVACGRCPAPAVGETIIAWSGPLDMRVAWKRSSARMVWALGCAAAKPSWAANSPARRGKPC